MPITHITHEVLDSVLRGESDNTSLRGVIAMAMCHYADEMCGMSRTGHVIRLLSINVMGGMPLVPVHIGKFDASAREFIIEDANRWMHALRM